jgi:hypothetical protein
MTEENDKEQENNEENQSIHTQEPEEESPEENVENEENLDVDIDQSGEPTAEEQYAVELEAWFEQLEKLHGVDFANKMRQKILLTKQISNELDYMAYSKQAHEDAQERLQVIRDQNDALFERTQKLVEQATNLNAKSYARFTKFLADSEARDKVLEQKLAEILDLKKKKMMAQ